MATTEVGSSLPSSRKIPPTNVEKGLDGREGDDDCECRVEQCPQCQQEVVKSSKDHLEDCSHQVPCKLKLAGCDFKGSHYEMAQHMDEHMLDHLTLISEFIKKEKEKHEKLKLVTIGVRVGVGVIVGLIFLGGFLYLKTRKASLESVKSLEDSVATNASGLQQLGKEFKDSVAKNARGLQQLGKEFKDSVAKNDRGLQQLGKEFKVSLAKNARRLEQLREVLDTTQGSLWETVTSYLKFWQK